MARMTPIFAYLTILFCLNNHIDAQNYGSSIAPYLVECYNQTDLFVADRRLPSTINVLIDLIRKAEDGRTTQDARQLSSELIHRFRQDGILRSTDTAEDTEFSLPFSPVGIQASKNRVLQLILIPGSAVNFPNETLNALESCSLHFILSSTVDTTIRNDESNVCNRLGRYERRGRSVDDDVEVFEKDQLYKALRGNMEEAAETPAEPSDETPEETLDTQHEETEDDPVESLDEKTRTGALQSLSDCPVEGGVIYTRWGAVQAGTVIAGIAAGLAQQTIENLVDSRFAATLSGDLAKALLFQTGRTGAVRSVGATGGWNSTQVPRWYFINSNTNFEMTDADIRAGIDGLIIAQNVVNWRNSFQTIKVSQILDLYYSQRGVFNEEVRACNRYNLLATVAPTETLIAQTTAFTPQLDRFAVSPGSIIPAGIPTLSQRIVNLFNQYAPTMSSSDLQCSVDTKSRNRIATEIIIVLDTAWTHNVAQAAISYILDNLDVNRFESSYMIINGGDGGVIVNSSTTILDYHQRFNLTVQQAHQTGFQYSRMYAEVENIVRERMDNFTDVGGKSTIAVFMPSQATVSEADRNFARERLEMQRSLLPDLRIMVLGPGQATVYTDLTTGGEMDVFTLQNSIDGTNIVTALNPFLDRVRDIPRRLINPACRSDFSGSEGETHTHDDFLEPQTINYYRISPNYFFGDGDRSLIVRGQGYGTFVVCTSRTDMYVSQNSTAADRDCRNINSNEETFIMDGFCTGGLILDCAPFYISVQSTAVNTIWRCTDVGCRFPDNIKFTFTLVNFSCRSSSTTIMGSVALIAVMLALLKW
ncbi:uncharacterized protein [Onthophagus taurus]|uniref:uncharacterized protein n=1 Tax=Onthophagus taurus TaxID=166361 RepID=UPI000C1FF64C|nr:uncharacterized protein LOC111414176 [Onthophagus taurus]